MDPWPIFDRYTARELENKLRSSSFEGNLYRVADQIRREMHDAIEQRWPRTWRRASGYSINYLTGYSPGAPPAWYAQELSYPPTAGFNLTPLLSGSEGTLAIIRSLKLRLVKRPAHTVLAVLAFDSIEAAADATLAVLETRSGCRRTAPANPAG